MARTVRATGVGGSVCLIAIFLGAEARSDEHKIHHLDIAGASHDCVAAAKMDHAPGWAPGCVALGTAYMYGDTLDSTGKRIHVDYGRASYYLDLGCRSASDAIACSYLAEMYEKGWTHSPGQDDTDVALDLYQRACDSQAPKSEAACQVLASRLIGKGSASKIKQEAAGYFARAVGALGKSCSGGDDYSCDMILNLFKCPDFPGKR